MSPTLPKKVGAQVCPLVLGVHHELLAMAVPGDTRQQKDVAQADLGSGCVGQHYPTFRLRYGICRPK